MPFQKQYTDLREVKLVEANALLKEGFELLYVTTDRWWEKCPEGGTFGMRARVRYVVGKPN